MTAYDSALATIRIATRDFSRIQAAHHSGEITDLEFLTARATYKAAEKVYEAAYVAARSIRILTRN
jgi:hypothetical protein